MNKPKILRLVRSFALKIVFFLAAIVVLYPVNASLVVSKDRPYWRYCEKCHVMFSTEATANVCAAGGTHVAQGYQFRLPFGGQETPTKQSYWRCCNKCGALFFNYYKENKGHCPAGGGHRWNKGKDPDWRYLLTHDVPGTPTTQSDWRFCSKCYAMFYDGYADKGHCAAGGGHLAQGFNFVLPHGR